MNEENATKNCPYCGESISIIAKKCKHCGEIIDETMRELENLKRQSNSNGPVVINNNNNNNNNGGVVFGPQKSKIVALLLCFFFGWLGAHRLYVGKVGSGIFQFILCCSLIGIIWVIIDFIAIICGGFSDSFNRPLK